MKKAVPLEIERKYLIRVPDEGLLDSLAVSRDWIEQTYLIPAEAGLTDRVRARRAVGGETRYTHTVKRPVSAMTHEEDEESITAEDYAALLQRADPALQVIRKTRWCIPFEGHMLEIDRYPFWKDRAVVEVELGSEDEQPALPDWLDVIRELTGDKR